MVEQSYQVPNFVDVRFTLLNAINLWLAILRTGFVEAGRFNPDFVTAARQAVLGYLNENLPKVFPLKVKNEDKRLEAATALV